MFIKYLWNDPTLYFCWIIAMLFSSCLHEFVHTFVAFKLNEGQALVRRTFTLNPFEIFNKMALFCLVLFGIIWGIPAIRSDMLKSYRKGAVISLAGPLVNLVLAFIFAFLLFVCLQFFMNNMDSRLMSIYTNFLITACRVNCILLVLYMLPIPGLDGWGLLESLFEPIRNMDFKKKTIITFTAILVIWATPISAVFYTISEKIFTLINTPFMKCLNV